MASSVSYTQDGLVVTSPYDPGLITEYKDRVPSWGRKYDPSRRVWIFDPSFSELILAIVRSHFPDVRVIGMPKDSSGHVDSDADHRVLFLLNSAPLPVVRAVYRVLAKTAHPDLGGDLTTMQQINAAFSRIEQQAGDRS